MLCNCAGGLRLVSHHAQPSVASLAVSLTNTLVRPKLSVLIELSLMPAIAVSVVPFLSFLSGYCALGPGF